MQEERTQLDVEGWAVPDVLTQDFDGEVLGPESAVQEPMIGGWDLPISLFIGRSSCLFGRDRSL